MPCFGTKADMCNKTNPINKNYMSQMITNETTIIYLLLTYMFIWSYEDCDNIYIYSVAKGYGWDDGRTLMTCFRPTEDMHNKTNVRN